MGRSFCIHNGKEGAHEADIYKGLVALCVGEMFENGMPDGYRVDRYRCGVVRRELAGSRIRVNPCGYPVAVDFPRRSS